MRFVVNDSPKGLVPLPPCTLPATNPIKSSQQLRGHTMILPRLIFEKEQRSNTQFDRDQVLLLARSTTFIFPIWEPTMRRRAWTTKDVRTLKRLADKRTRTAKIARTLRRTEGATRQKAFSLGLSLESRAAKI
jgi:hypothetical protein